MRDRLIELISQVQYMGGLEGRLADHLLANEVIVLPSVVYNKKHERYQVINKSKQGHMFASKMYRTKNEAEKALAERSGK